jgi:hypothetical protein
MPSVVRWVGIVATAIVPADVLRLPITDFRRITWGDDAKRNFTNAVANSRTA